MAVVVKSVDDVLLDIADSLIDSNANVQLDVDTLDDFNQGSKLKILSRAVARVASDCWRALGEAEKDSDPSRAEDEAQDVLGNAFGLGRKPGSPAQGFLFAEPKSPGNTDVVQAGDLFLLAGKLYVCAQQTALTGTSTVFPIQAATVGAQGTLPAGTTLLAARSTLNDGFTFRIGNAKTGGGTYTGSMSRGENRESNTDYRIRFGDYLLSLTKGTLRAVLQALRGVSGVQAVSVVEYVPSVGFISVHIDDGSSNLTIGPTLKATIEETLLEWRAAGIIPRILAVEKVRADILLDVTIARGNVLADRKAEIESLLSAELSLFALGETLYISRLVDIAHNIEGVLSVQVLKPTTLSVEVGSQEVFRPRSVTVNVHF